MITRIVRITFRAEEIKQFIRIFDLSVNLIESFEGCLGVELMKDAGNENVFFTLSKWESEDHLNQYRSSALFKSTWAEVKPLFAEKADAWSLIDFKQLS